MSKKGLPCVGFHDTPWRLPEKNNDPDVGKRRNLRRAGRLRCLRWVRTTKVNMNQNAIRRVLKLGRGVAAAGCSVAVLLCQSSFGQTIQNPSFEASSFNNAPGSISGNSPIPGWTSSGDDFAGLNPAGGESTYANNGVVPQGNNVAWLQYGTSLSTDVTGLTPGTKYKVTFRANAGTMDPGPTVSLILRASIDDAEVLALNIYPVGPGNPYMYVAFEFEATAATQKLTILNDNFGNEALLLDDFTIAPSTRWTVDPWSSDDDSGIDNSFVYSHAYNFNGANTTIKGVPFTGVAGGNPAVAGKFTTLALGNAFANDGNNVTGGSRTLANDFLYSSSVPPGNYQTINMEGLTPGTEYVFTLYTVAFDPPSPAIRWATFAVGEDRLTINQDQYDNDNGMTISYRYTADETGKASFRIAPINPVNVSIHVYGFSNREAVSRNVAPAIIAQPRSTIVSPGVAVDLMVNATGFPEPTYEWRLNGTAISGATSPTYSIAQAQAQSAGRYEVVVANSLGSVTSHVATVTVGIPLENPSFEADLFSTWPGYANANAPITGWTLSDLAGAGLNPVEDGTAPFIDNGVVPNGRQAAFLQDPRTLSQTVTGLTPGAEYYLHYNENARLDVTDPGLQVRMGDTVIVPEHVIVPVGAGNPFHDVYAAFTATAASMDLAFTKSTPQGGDATALIDNVSIVPIPAGTAPFLASSPRPVSVSVGESASFSGQGIGSSPVSYQWLKNGQPISQATSNTFALTSVQETDEADYALVVSNASGSVTSIVAHLTVFEPIASLYNTGVDDQRAPLAEGAVDPHYVLLTNPDTGGTEAIVEGLLPGAWLANNTASQWIGPKLNTVDSAVGLFTYRTTFTLVDRDPDTVMIMGRWLSDNTGREIRVNGTPIIAPLSTSFTAWADFAIYGTNVDFVAGTNTIDFVVENETAIGYTGLRVEFVRSNVQTPAGIAPQITGQPLSRTVSEGESVTFTASATGSAPLSYQWTKNGVELAGQTGLTLTIASATAADAGAYRIRVTNPVGSVTSEAANLSVPYRVLPNVAFGTGLDANGQLLEAGSVDPHYILSESSDGENMGPDAIVVNEGWPVQAGVWLPNGPNSKWISVRADQGTAGAGPGPYTYQTTVNLTGQDVSKVRLIGAWGSDDGGTDILLNGVSLGVANGGFGGLTPFVITNGLTAGVNTLDFQLANGGDANGPSGLRVDLKAFVEVEQVQQPTITITRSGDNVTISWSPTAAGQKLQSRSDLTTGTWQDVPNATNPYTTNASTGRMFFRIAQ
jgi:hypothetical protein